MSPRFYKYEKSEVEYTSKAMNKDEQCKKCIHYAPDYSKHQSGSCDLVIGDIDPGGWCNKFEAEK